MLPGDALRAAFPALAARPDLVFLDNAATAQKPHVVIETVAGHWARGAANVRRAAHRLAGEATAAYDDARRTVAAFIGADPADCVFTSGTTAGINLVAEGWLAPRLLPGDEVLVSAFEHHTNLLPWRLACAVAGARVVVAPVTPAGELDVAGFAALVTPRTRLVAVTHVSNVFGTVLPLRQIVDAARGAPVLVDAAQSAAHLPLSVAELGCDFLAFSGHKCHGPDGVGVLWARPERWEETRVVHAGGEMVDAVGAGTYDLAPRPWRFEAGTPPVSGALGLAAALRFLAELDRPAVLAHERALADELSRRLAALPGVRVHGSPRERIGIVCFTIDGVHPHDAAQVLDEAGVAVRAGYHCAEPLHRALDLGPTLRASLACHSDESDIGTCVAAVEKTARFFRDGA